MIASNPISSIIKQVLKDRGMLPIELARRTEYTRQYVSDLLAGKRRWNEVTLIKVCEVLDLQIVFVNADRRQHDVVQRKSFV